MANKKVSELPSVDTMTLVDTFLVIQSATSKKADSSQIKKLFDSVGVGNPIRVQVFGA